MVITGSDGTESGQAMFNLRLSLTCNAVSLSINAGVINQSIEYTIDTGEATYEVDPTEVSMNLVIPMCPAVNIEIINRDGSLLDPNLFKYDSVKSEFKIATKDESSEGIYKL